MLMKNGLSISAAKRIVHAIKQVSPNFKGDEFISYIEENIEPLELKERVDFYIEALAKYFPENYTECIDILMSIKPHWDYGDPDDPIRSFAAWPLTDFIAKHGLSHPELSFAAMKELTSLFSAEFAIRYFIKHDETLALEYLNDWVGSDDHHVRRLVSEGTRPRLPWGIRLHQYCEDPSPCLPLLEKLKDDPSEYVRRSVANHLNDIAKDNPQIVVDVCRRWSKNASKETQWVIKHACRTLIKAGNRDVFPLLGFTQSPKVKISEPRLASNCINLGDSLEFEVTIDSNSKSDQKLAVDFVIHHVKANGQLSPKVFKLKELTLKPSQSLSLVKKHAIKPITTRKYYPGEHLLDIQINGTVFTQTKFNLNTG